MRFFIISAFLFLAMPALAFAADTSFFGPIVPECARTAGQPCGACDLVTMADNLLKFLVSASVFAATLMFAYAGFLYVTAAGSKGNLDSARKIFWNVFLGLVFVLTAWLIVDLGLRVLTNQNLNVLTRVECVYYTGGAGSGFQGSGQLGGGQGSGTGEQPQPGLQQPPAAAEQNKGLQNVDSNTNYNPYLCDKPSDQNTATGDKRTQGCQQSANGKTIVTVDDYKKCQAGSISTTPAGVSCSNVKYVTVAAPQGSGFWKECFTHAETASRYSLNSNTVFCADDHYGAGRGYTPRGTYSFDVARCWSAVPNYSCGVVQRYGNECTKDKNGNYPCTFTTKPTSVARP